PLSTLYHNSEQLTAVSRKAPAEIPRCFEMLSAQANRRRIQSHSALWIDRRACRHQFSNCRRLEISLRAKRQARSARFFHKRIPRGGAFLLQDFLFGTAHSGHCTLTDQDDGLPITALQTATVCRTPKCF